MPVRILRSAAERYGFGRIHVKLVDKEGAGYLAKYLAKQGRSECFQGKRLCLSFGPFEHCKVKDVEVESNFTEAVWFKADPPSDFSGRKPPRKGGQAQDFLTFGI